MPNAVVRELSVDKNTGLVNEAHFVDRISRREMSVKARVVVLAAGTLESTRLLLNSGSPTPAESWAITSSTRSTAPA